MSRKTPRWRASQRTPLRWYSHKARAKKRKRRMSMNSQAKTSQRTSRPCQLRIEAVDRDVEHRRRVAGTLERGGGPRDGERLMPELVTRDEENLAGATHRQRSITI